MSVVLFLARLFLATVFLVSSLTKLADRVGTRQALQDFGLPMMLATPVGFLLPVIELVIAVTMISTSLAWWSSVGALVLLLLFIAGISFNLANGRKPDCNCFGQLHSTPVSWKTIVRNTLFAFIAVFIIWQGRENAGLSVVTLLGSLTISQIAELLVAVVLLMLVSIEGWFIVHLIRQQGRLLLRIEALEVKSTGNVVRSEPASVPGLHIGDPAPAFQLVGLSGEWVTLDSLLALGQPVLLIFSDPNCSPCNTLMPSVARWQQNYVSKLTIVVISRRAADVNRAKSIEYGIRNVLLQQNDEISQAYQAFGTPIAVLVRSDGTIGSTFALGPEAISDLVNNVVEIPRSAHAPMTLTQRSLTNDSNGVVPISQWSISKIGQAAPDLKLPDLTGKIVDLADFRGNNTLILFWNPNCGFCNQISEEIKKLENDLSGKAMKLLIVSTGSIEANQAMGFRSTIVIEPNFGIGRKFGAAGTPSGVLIDADGTIVSEVAVGGPDVLALAQVQQQGVLTKAPVN